MKITSSFKFDKGDFQNKLIAIAENDAREKLRAKGIRGVTVKLDAASKEFILSGSAEAVAKATKVLLDK